MFTDFDEFSKIIQTIDYLLALEEEGKDIYPQLVSWKVALKRDNPDFAKKLDFVEEMDEIKKEKPVTVEEYDDLFDDE